MAIKVIAQRRLLKIGKNPGEETGDENQGGGNGDNGGGTGTIDQGGGNNGGGTLNEG